MKTLAILFAVLGVMAMLAFDPDVQIETHKAESVAVNYGIYRNAVNRFATGTVTITSGQIPDSYLDLPSGWKPMRAWSNRVENGNCYVWGFAGRAEADEIRELFMNSYAVGVKRNGHLVNGHGTGIALPAFIPERSIVSVITP
ncbi:type IV pilus biogenesis protein PilM [Maridesulfovibrio hydrothermalis]|uniref:Putative PilM protein n=1 Tax=Maridesulfovibrio hydrothermalis AM13 = DSM 14728 TaxID=1121451 RepID=L0RBA1_9BACT|nr:type IV pilus biogenesis protein PilM [Maridesulfovibrio hydrothermalis]CCO24029.1 putative PilM protein [Maridesulfovibrio hydrothermalis AM13 = DSM 14728]